MFTFNLGDFDKIDRNLPENIIIFHISYSELWKIRILKNNNKFYLNVFL